MNINLIVGSLLLFLNFAIGVINVVQFIYHPNWISVLGYIVTVIGTTNSWMIVERAWNEKTKNH